MISLAFSTPSLPLPSLPRPMSCPSVPAEVLDQMRRTSESAEVPVPMLTQTQVHLHVSEHLWLGTPEDVRERVEQRFVALGFDTFVATTSTHTILYCSRGAVAERRRRMSGEGKGRGARGGPIEEAGGGVARSDGHARRTTSKTYDRTFIEPIVQQSRRRRNKSV